MQHSPPYSAVRRSGDNLLHANDQIGDKNSAAKAARELCVNTKTTFRDLIETPKNNLNLIRLVAALAVTFSHAYVLTGHAKQEPWLMLTGAQTFAYLAVFVFFVVSGLLISRSFDQNSNIGYYIGSRVLRIYPALLMSVVLCALPLGLAFTHLPISDYLHNARVLNYIVENLRFNTNYELPGVFVNTPVSNTVNGSLWTLAIEVYAYFMVVIFALLGLLKSRSLFNVTAAMLVLLYMKEPAGFLLVPGEWDTPVFIPLAGFLFGAFVYVNRCHIQGRLRYIVLLLIIYGIFQDSVVHRTLFTVAVGYVVLVIGFHQKLQLNIFLKNDYSYGIYIYSFPIQQAIVFSLPDLQPLQHFVLAMLCILPLAALSWHLLEKPALQLKRFLPGPAQRPSSLRKGA